jgi:large subunit ribosomal protein L17
MLSNVVASLIDHERVTTTLRIARSARRYADRMVTLAKKNTLHTRRQAVSFLRPSGPDRKETVRKLFSEIGPRYAERPGGYTRIYKIDSRRGDNAPMAVIEFVDAKVVLKERRKPRHEEEELQVETEVTGDVQEQVQEEAEAAVEPAETVEPVAEAPAQEEGAPAEPAAEEKPETEPAAEEKEKLKDRKGGVGRFFKGLFHKDD